MQPSHRGPPVVRGGVDGTVQTSLQAFGGREAVLARTASDRRRGALARRDGDSLAEAARTALRLRLPLVLELASSGADVSEGIDALHGWGGAAAAVAACSGVVPVLAVVTGPVISGPALLLGLADLVVMTARPWPSSPARRWWRRSPASGSVWSSSGGVAVHAGVERPVRHRGGPTSRGGRRAPGLPARPRRRGAALVPTPDPPTGRCRSCASGPGRGNASYDVRDVVAAMADDGSVVRAVGAGWAPQLVTGLARLAGRAGRRGGQPAPVARRHAGHRRLAEGRPASSGSVTPSTCPS